MDTCFTIGLLKLQELSPFLSLSGLSSRQPLLMCRVFSFFAITLWSATLLFAVAAKPMPAAAEDWLPTVQWQSPLGSCDGNCAVHASIGRFTRTNMTNAFAMNEDFKPDAGDFVAPWNYDYEDSFLISATASRRVLTVGSWASAEIEAGVGQRFGDMHATEMWGAIYFRWHAFPWNELIYTTVAVSTGLNYATGVEDLERARDDHKRGNQLLHYLSPEITFAIPENRDWELVFRLHHRSGGGAIFGDTWLFNGVTGGANHMTAGVRYRF